MDKSAIEAIAQLSAAKTTQEKLEAESIASVWPSSAVLVPDDYALLSTEKFQSAPNFFTGTFATHIISDFVSYVNKNGSDQTGVFVDTKSMMAQAIIDLGQPESPKWGRHRAELTLKQSSEFCSAWTNQHKSFTQQQFIDFFEDWAECISFIDDKNNLIDIGSALAAIRKLTVKQHNEKTSQVGDYKQVLSEFDQLEVAAGEQSPPAGFCFSCIPYDELEMVKLVCRLRATIKDNNVFLSYRVIGLDRVLDDLGQELLQLLAKDIEVADDFYCGEFSR